MGGLTARTYPVRQEHDVIKHRIDGKSLADWEKFHDFFASTFDFPDYYGRNMDVWNDCMSDYCYSKGLLASGSALALAQKKEQA